MRKFRLFDRATGKQIIDRDLTAFLFRSCLKLGHHVGGDERVKTQATADLLQFLRDAEVLHDDEARAIVPDCAAFAEEIHRHNCVRARNGWTGDLVAVARALRAGGGQKRDDTTIRRLLELAAVRGSSHAKWELSIMLRQGAGVASDHARALGLARAAAEAGDAAGMNVYAVAVRDGIGQPPNDAEAAIWFQRAADLRNSSGMSNLAKFMWEGRGGLPIDRPAAVLLWRRAIFLDENPWARLFLGEALEKGEGVARDEAEALHLFQATATQNREPQAKQRAVDALLRLQQKRGSK